MWGVFFDAEFFFYFTDLIKRKVLKSSGVFGFTFILFPCCLKVYLKDTCASITMLVEKTEE